MTTNKVWPAITVVVIPEAVEAVEFAFNSLDALGTSVDMMRPNEKSICVVGYFDELPDRPVFDKHLRDALSTYSFGSDAIVSIQQSEIADADWLAEWKKYWRPTEVGRFVIAPTWTEIEDRSDRIIVRIEPNMAFGTGTHETTRLCLQAIDKHFKPGMSFLDIGTGTGILAIAAAKLAQKLGRDAGRIVACDTDPDAIKIACENASLNGVGDIIEFRVGSIDVDAFTPQPPPFDFICANLTLDTILPILDLLLERSGRLLVLSGILAEQLGRILNELDRRGIRNTSVRRDGEWIAVFNEAKAVR